MYLLLRDCETLLVIYFFQTLSLKTRFLGLLMLCFPVLLFQWLLTGAPWALAHLKMSAHGIGLPDAEFWYDPATLQDFFTAWGEEGRLQYLTILWPTDLGFLLSYGALLISSTLYLLKKVNPAGPWWYLLPVVPLAASGLDFLENSAVALALLLPASGWEPISWAAAFFTSAEWSVLGLSLAILLIGTVRSLLVGAWTKVRLMVEKSESSRDESDKER